MKEEEKASYRPIGRLSPSDKTSSITMQTAYAEGVKKVTSLGETPFLNVKPLVPEFDRPQGMVREHVSKLENSSDDGRCER